MDNKPDDRSKRESWTTTTLDSQATEVIGRALLIVSLYRDGIEVAEPQRDHGVDLIAYTDRDQFAAWPLQLKVSTDRRFEVHRKYEAIPGLVLTYVWCIHSQPEMFAMSYQEAEAICEQRGWTQTRSWRGETSAARRREGHWGRSGWGTGAITPALRELLSPYNVGEPGSWRRRLAATT